MSLHQAQIKAEALTAIYCHEDREEIEILLEEAKICLMTKSHEVSNNTYHQEMCFWVVINILCCVRSLLIPITARSSPSWNK